eukprot:7391945-Prymnesium_polylepis.1
MDTVSVHRRTRTRGRAGLPAQPREPHRGLGERRCNVRTQGGRFSSPACAARSYTAPPGSSPPLSSARASSSRKNSSTTMH